MNLPSASTQTTVDAQPRSEVDTRLRGHWLVLARVVLVMLAMLTLGLIIASIPSYFAFLHVVCTGATATCRNNGQIIPDDLRALSLVYWAHRSIAIGMCLARDNVSRRSGSSSVSPSVLAVSYY